MTRAQAVASAIGLFAVWTLATYLLEGRVGTFLRPDTTSRFVEWQPGWSSFLAATCTAPLCYTTLFAIRGVIQALAESGNLDRYAGPQLPLIATAIAAIVVLIIADVVLIRPLVGPHPE